MTIDDMHAAFNLMGLNPAMYSNRSYEINIPSITPGEIFKYTTEIVYLFGNSIKYKEVIYYPSEFEELLLLITKDLHHDII